jgi:hypothetical protein
VEVALGEKTPHEPMISLRGAEHVDHVGFMICLDTAGVKAFRRRPAVDFFRPAPSDCTQVVSGGSSDSSPVRVFINLREGGYVGRCRPSYYKDWKFSGRSASGQQHLQRPCGRTIQKMSLPKSRCLHASGDRETIGNLLDRLSLFFPLTNRAVVSLYGSPNRRRERLSPCSRRPALFTAAVDLDWCLVHRFNLNG